MRQIVVIGAGAAGMAAATRARRVDPTASVTVLEASSEYSRGTCSLPYFVSGEIAKRESLTGINLEALAEARIDLRLSTPVAAIEPAQRKVVTAKGERLQYERLIVSTGSRPKSVPTVSGGPSHPRLWRLRTIADAQHIRESLVQVRPQKVAVVGGGYLGLEMAEVLTQRGCQVTIFHRQATLMRLSGPCQQNLLTHLAQHGVKVRLQCEVALVDVDCRQRTIEFLDPREGRLSEGFDAVFLAPGIEPEASLLAAAGARLGRQGGVLVDSRGETSLAGVLAAGDGVELPASRGEGGSRFIPLATTAARLGRVCGENAAGGCLRMPEALASIAVRLFTLQIAAVGHPADWSGADEITVDFGCDRSPFPRRRAGRATFLCQPRGGRLLGAQFVAPEACAMADLVSLALSRDMTLNDLQDLDANYTPTLSALWHPFYLAARQSQKALAGVRA